MASIPFFKSVVKNLPASASIAIEGKSSSEFDGYIDTGSYTLNAALSGTLFGGMPNNKITAFAGDPATGKTFFALSIIKTWLKNNPEGGVVYFDTESAVTNAMLEAQGIPLDRVLKVEPATIEEFRQSAVKILKDYEEEDAKTRPPMVMVLDSLGNMSSSKEIQDIVDQKDSRDMTKAGLLKGTFRVLRLMLARLNVAMIVTNHVYAIIGAYIPSKAMSGGSGLVYVADSIAMLSKTKERDKEKTIVGNLITVKMAKSRLSRENVEVEVRLSYDSGLDRYSGLLEMGVEAGLIEKGTVGRYTFLDTKVTATEAKINEAPEKFFTDAFLTKLDSDYVRTHFRYGNVAALTETESE